MAHHSCSSEPLTIPHIAASISEVGEWGCPSGCLSALLGDPIFLQSCGGVAGFGKWGCYGDADAGLIQ